MFVAEWFLLTLNCSACHGSVISASFYLCFLDCCGVFGCFSLLCSCVSSPAWLSPSHLSNQPSSLHSPHLCFCTSSLVSLVCIYIQSLVQSLSSYLLCFPALLLLLLLYGNLLNPLIFLSAISVPVWHLLCFHEAFWRILLELYGKTSNLQESLYACLR